MDGGEKGGMEILLALIGIEGGGLVGLGKLGDKGTPNKPEAEENHR